MIMEFWDFVCLVVIMFENGMMLIWGFGKRFLVDGRLYLVKKSYEEGGYLLFLYLVLMVCDRVMWIVVFVNFLKIWVWFGDKMFGCIIFDFGLV